MDVALEKKLPAQKSSTPFVRGKRRVISVNTLNCSLVFMVNEEGFLFHRYFGKRLQHPESVLDFVLEDVRRYVTFEMPSSFGGYYAGEPAVAICHADGNLSSDLRYHSHSQTKKANVVETRIRMRDSHYGFWITICLSAYQDEDIIASHLIFENKEGGEVILSRFASGELALSGKEYWLSYFAGEWSAEMRLKQSRLETGLFCIENKRGVRTSQHTNASFMLSIGAPATEETGEVVAGTLAWSGNYRICFEQDIRGNLHLNAAINPFASEYHLEPGERFETPAFIFTYSDEGMGVVSRRFHRWARRYVLCDSSEERPVVFNSWEGAYFDFDEKKIVEMIGEAADLGAEIFVLDDGWFGGKYPRNSTESALGDWFVNEKKLPRGLEYLIDCAENAGLRFGIWVEPEMTNLRSELAETHPNWIVRSPVHDPILVRNQLLLDLSNPSVQEFVFASVDGLLRAHPRIAYVKWDCNRHMCGFGSHWLVPDRQSHWWIEYNRGLYAVCARLIKAHPNVIFQSCGSGGGRMDYGIMRYCYEFWPSDNTDAVERIFIQWGTGYFYPAMSIAAHVSAAPNHQTGTMLPLKFRFDTAASARLGFELRKESLSKNGVEFIRSAVDVYKRVIRPLVTNGDLYRISSPYGEQGIAALSYVSPKKDRAVAFLYVLHYRPRLDYPVLKFRGLDPEGKYRLKELNRNPTKSACMADGKTFDGNFLMNHGILLELLRPFESATVELIKEK